LGDLYSGGLYSGGLIFGGAYIRGGGGGGGGLIVGGLRYYTLEASKCFKAQIQYINHCIWFSKFNNVVLVDLHPFSMPASKNLNAVFDLFV
jgi:hypothetical protein